MTVISERDSEFTVKDLLDALLRVPSDARIITEGCDCYGDVFSVELDEKGNKVYLNRRRDE